MKKYNSLVYGIILIILGVFVDRILYFVIYLPKIDKAFALYVKLEDLIQFYSYPLNWIGLFLILVGLICLYWENI